MLMFFGQNHVLWDIIFAVSSGLANYLGTNELSLQEFIFAI